ncbi:MAG: hypothetical protein DMD64_07915 [Gemmatimonadetes bacterium]|nr:MAG: hypothetical protein DMD64_07915 [Gemmatimonadota bacterium]
MNSSKKAGAVLALALLAGWGCSDFLNGPGLTENPNNPLVATPIQILVSIQANVATRLEGQLARCASVFTQQLIGSNNQQLQWCTAYLVGESDISGQMSGFYTGGGLYGIRQVEAAAQTAGDNQMLGEAKILEGLMMGTATSVWGDLPYTEALTPGIDSPKLDSQQSLYAAVQTRLDEGIAALTTVLASATGNCSTLEGDVIYCSAAGSRATELQRWIRAAHTLKARFHLHLAERNGVTEYNAALAEALLGINEVPTSQTNAIHGQGAGDFRTFHGSVQDLDANIWAEFLSSRQDIVAGNTLVSILKARNDTVRLRNYFDLNSQGQYVGADQNNVTVRPAGCPAPPAACAPSVVNTLVRRQFTFRQPLVTWAENQLILAEARFMTGDSAGGAANVNAVRTAVGLPTLAAPTFTDVMTEKYIAQYQNIDVWSDYKRTCIPTLTPNGTNPEVIGRLPYGSAERTANANVPLPSAYPTGTTGSSPVRNWDDPNACP